MRLWRAVLMITLFAELSGCGARSGLERWQSERRAVDGGVDAIEPPRPTCRDRPTCIEAQITTPSGETIDFASEGEVTVALYMGRGVWLMTPESAELYMSVQITFEAEPGPVDYTLNPTDFYVDLRFPEYSCNIRGEGSLEEVDLAPGGLTEGTFSGATRDVCGGGEYLLRQGWFRVTVPD